eukprot:jgi/Ulvmu1/12839/UM098_0024.1
MPSPGLTPASATGADALKSACLTLSMHRVACSLWVYIAVNASVASVSVARAPQRIASRTATTSSLTALIASFEDICTDLMACVNAASWGRLRLHYPRSMRAAVDASDCAKWQHKACIQPSAMDMPWMPLSRLFELARMVARGDAELSGLRSEFPEATAHGSG